MLTTVPERHDDYRTSRDGPLDITFSIAAPPTYSIWATMDESPNPSYDVFREHSAVLLIAIQDPEVLAWELFAEKIISSTVRDAATNTMHRTDVRTSSLLAAVAAKIAASPGTFDVFLSVLAKRASMAELCERMRAAYGKEN